MVSEVTVTRTNPVSNKNAKTADATLSKATQLKNDLPNAQEVSSLLAQAQTLIDKASSFIVVPKNNKDPKPTLSKELSSSLSDVSEELTQSINLIDELSAPIQDIEVQEEIDVDDLWPDEDHNLLKQSTSEPTSVRTNATDIEYAPQKPVKQGEKSLCVVRVAWASGGSASAGSVQRAARTVSDNYKRLSGGLFNIKSRAVTLQVPWKNNYKYVKAAESRAKSQFKADWYAICTGGAAGVSHAGGRTAILRATGAITHEVGHLIGLGHANRYELDKKFAGKPGTTGMDGHELDLKYFKLNSSADGSSVMSTFASAQLTAPQLYSLGWLKQNQVALHRIESGPKQYELQTLTSGNIPGRVKAVLIPGGETGRDIFLSAVNVKVRGKDQGMRPALTLHLGNPGSNRVVTFGAKPLSFRGLTFEAKKRENHLFTVEIRPFTPKK